MSQLEVLDHTGNPICPPIPVPPATQGRITIGPILLRTPRPDAITLVFTVPELPPSSEEDPDG